MRSAVLQPLARTLSRVVDAVQVEHQGQYSTERLRLLHDYVSTKYSIVRLACLLIATPIPPIVLMVLVDAFPLAPPELGADRNIVFWAWLFCMNAILCTSASAQLCAVLPDIPLSRIKIAAAVAFSSVVTMLFGYALSLAIGFPVSFSITLGSLAGPITLVGPLLPDVLRFVRVHPEAKAVLRDFHDLFSLITSQILVYPLCNYVFQRAHSVHPLSQPAVALLLVAVKIAYKIGFNRCLRAQPDLRAQVINFQGEIFRALSTTFSVQSATSALTLLALWIADAVHAGVMLYEAYRSVQVLEVLERDLVTEGRLISGNHSVIARTSAILTHRGSRPPREGEARRSDGHHQDPVHDRNRESTAGDSNSNQMKRSWLPKMSRYTKRHQVAVLHHDSVGCRSPSVVPPAPACQVNTNNAAGHPKASGVRKSPSVGTPNNHGRSPPTSMIKSIAVRPLSPTTTTSGEDAYTEKALALLYMTEFVVLTEFVEIVVPVVYGEWLAGLVVLVPRH